MSSVGKEGGRGGAILLDIQFWGLCLATIFGVTKSTPLSKEAVGNSWDLLNAISLVHILRRKPNFAIKMSLITVCNWSVHDRLFCLHQRKGSR